MKIVIAGATGLVGSQLTMAAERAGHEVVGLSRRHGVDLTTGEGLDLPGDADALIDVTQSASQEQAEATRFFEAVGATLGATDVPRKVVLSIIGVDKTAADNGYFAAKLAHEEAYGGGAQILRAAQFHDLAEQMIGWMRDGDTVTVPDLRMQPVAIEVVVDALLAMATGVEDRPLVEVAGPQQERLADLVARIAPPEVTVKTVPAGAAVDAGGLFPGVGAIIGGRSFDEWRSVVSGVSAT